MLFSMLLGLLSYALFIVQTLSCTFVLMPLFSKLGVVIMRFLYLNIGLMHLKYNGRLTSMKILLDVVWLMQ